MPIRYSDWYFVQNYILYYFLCANGNFSVSLTNNKRYSAVLVLVVESCSFGRKSCLLLLTGNCFAGTKTEGRCYSTRFAHFPICAQNEKIWLINVCHEFLQEYIFFFLSAGIVIEEKNWPPFFPIIHHDISNEIPIHLQRIQYVAFTTFLGMSNCYF